MLFTNHRALFSAVQWCTLKSQRAEAKRSSLYAVKASGGIWSKITLTSYTKMSNLVACATEQLLCKRKKMVMSVSEFHFVSDRISYYCRVYFGESTSHGFNSKVLVFPDLICT
ncbi:Hypothetical predicted protein [Podarcis lilfordi]|uniref:Uncharacterized protein n=1 Tax=Podarcis lilfordi TaxID=74358 RepID=A0AA35KX87_9SAUR|nr:Hypothetical predicted protein [Podarcis lilfordi]